MTGEAVSALGTLMAVAAATAGATWLVMRELRRRAILDLPNDRSSHTVPVPRGGGLAVTPLLLLAWAGIGWTLQAGWPLAAPLLAAALLALVSWRDDLRSLSAGTRFGAQLMAVVAALAVLPSEALVFQGWLPVWADRLLAGFAWLWFVNLFNFMDGIDGIAGTEMATLGLGLAAVALLLPALGPGQAAGAAEGLPLYGAALAGAGLGFLALNWHPARIFLGDVGSVPVGFLAGWLLLHAAADGLWLPALILPAYYLADATLTLLRRGLRGEKVWRAHREHFYQRAASRVGHVRTMHGIAVGNAALVACALLSLWIGIWALGAAALAVLALLGWLRARAAA